MTVIGANECDYTGDPNATWVNVGSVGLLFGILGFSQ